MKVIRPEFVNRAEFVRRFESEAHLGPSSSTPTSCPCTTTGEILTGLIW